jgi:hypothetical protein
MVKESYKGWGVTLGKEHVLTVTPTEKVVERARELLTNDGSLLFNGAEALPDMPGFSLVCFLLRVL